MAGVHLVGIGFIGWLSGFLLQAVLFPGDREREQQEVYRFKNISPCGEFLEVQISYLKSHKRKLALSHTHTHTSKQTNTNADTHWWILDGGECAHAHMARQQNRHTIALNVENEIKAAEHVWMRWFSRALRSLVQCITRTKQKMYQLKHKPTKKWKQRRKKCDRAKDFISSFEFDALFLYVDGSFF